MPQISKVRIVNFLYNDGKRLIADELYDFTNKDSDKALNVLINLANGGGKSVLVQLMMQPVIPKAKVAGRKIESFFTRSTDHCFILIEWLKDNSTEKLLTGIAMAASEATASSEDDETRGRAVKYYTFFSNYSAYTTQYDIINLPLSKKENGRFVAADFDLVRGLAKKSGDLLNCYSSDENSKWQKIIAGYGLVQYEWHHLMEQLNSEEGGMSKFFGEFKTSDAIIDRLFIPVIEGKISQDKNSGDDGSLGTMLLGYARQYSRQKEVICERDICEGFARDLQEQKESVTRLWNLNDRFEKCTGTIFGFSDALAARLHELQTEIDSIKGQIQKTEDEMLKIRWEKCSEEYYIAEKNFKDISSELEKVSNIEHQQKNEYEKTKERIALLECANFYGKLKTIRNKISAIKEEIVSREQNTDDSARLSQLRYSIYSAVSTELPKQEETLVNDKNRLDELYKGLKEAEARVLVSDKQAKAAQSLYDSETGLLRAVKDESDKLCENLQLEIIRRFDRSYPQDELQISKKQKQTERVKTEEALCLIREERKNTEQRLEAIPEKKAGVLLKISAKEMDKERIEQEQKQYTTAEEKIKSICGLYNLDFSLRFTPSLLQYLESEKQNAQAQEVKCIRHLSVAEEEIQAAKRGSVHVPGAVIEYLNATGIRYQTCENYLLNQVETHHITKERCLEILKNYPAVAYGILIDSSESERLFACDREGWLPAMVPLFTAEQMEGVLSLQKAEHAAIAFYSEAYFSDREHYVLRLEEQVKTLCDNQARLLEKKSGLLEDIDTVKSFSYSAEWFADKTCELEKLNAEIAELRNNAKKLSDDEARLKEAKKGLHEKEAAQEEALRKINSWLDHFADLLERIENENKIAEKLDELRKKVDESEEVYCQCISARENIQFEVNNLNNSVKAEKSVCAELGNVLSEVENCVPCEIVPGEWRSLLEQYHALQKAQNDDLVRLKEELQQKQSREAELESDISKRSCEHEKYQNLIYSEAEEQEERKKERTLSLDLDAKSKQKEKLIHENGAAEQRYKSAQEALSEFEGKALDKNQIGGNFQSRIEQEKNKQRTLAEQKKIAEQSYRKIQRCFDQVSDKTSGYKRPESLPVVVLSDNPMAQSDALFSELSACRKSLKDTDEQFKYALLRMQSAYKQTNSGAEQAIASIIVLENNSNLKGDRYYTLMEQIDNNIHTTELRIAQIKRDLEEFDHSRSDLIHQCVLQGERIYSGLRRMAESSKVKVYADRPRQQIIKLDIPPDVEESVAAVSIAHELENGTLELVEKMAHTECTDVELRKHADKIVGSKQLLRRYIGKDSITLQAYKIDSNPQNGRYRTWEQTQINNSGAEKFVIYFAVILSLMSYTRSNYSDINDKEMRSVLILDNPFGPISSRHVLEPMFEIARHFKVQLVCLSDISKCDITSCFDMVIKAAIRQLTFSNVELLIHEGNEQIEHGFYRAEQISMWQ